MKRNTDSLVIVVFTVLALLLPTSCCVYMGVGGFGPTYQVTATVDRMWVDSGGESGSHYMVATDAGVFEVDNGLFLGIWNADEVYGQLLPGKKYRLTVKGNKSVSAVWQYYPYIIEAQKVNEPLEK